MSQNNSVVFAKVSQITEQDVAKVTSRTDAAVWLI